MGFSNLSKFPDMHTEFPILRCTKFHIPNLSGKNQKPRIHLSLDFDFISKTVVTEISQLLMFQVPHMWFIASGLASSYNNGCQQEKAKNQMFTVLD